MAEDHTFCITGPRGSHYVNITRDELLKVEGRYHDLVRKRAIELGHLSEIDARTSSVVPSALPPQPTANWK